MKSKMYKYRIKETPLHTGIFYRIQMRERKLFATWVNIQTVIFKTEAEAIEEIKTYIADDNENY